MDKCPYKEDFCERCPGTGDDFISNCFREDEFNAAALACPKCSEGIINPTLNLTMACDKCGYEETIAKIAQNEKFSFLLGLIE